MIEPLQILMVGGGVDGPTDALLEPLRRAGYDPRPNLVGSLTALSAAFAERQWDVVFLGEGSAVPAPLDVIAVTRRCDPEIPILLLTDRVEEAPALFEAGVTDLIPPSAWSRIGLSVARLRRRAGRREADALPALAARAPIGLVRLRSDGVVLYANDAAAVVLGATSGSELVGTRIADHGLELEDPPASQSSRTVVNRAANGSTVRLLQSTWPVLNETGDLLYIELAIAPIPDDAAASSAETKAVHRERMQRVRELTQVEEVSHDAFDQMVRILAEVAPDSCASIWLRDADDGELKCLARYYSKRDDVVRTPSNFGYEAFSATLAPHIDGGAALIEPTDLPDLVCQGIVDAGRGPVLAAPVRSLGETAGYLLVQVFDVAYTVSEDDLTLIQTLSDASTLLVERRRRSTVEHALQNSERRYRAVSELASDLAYAVALSEGGHGVIEWATEAFRRITGYDPSSGYSVKELIEVVSHPEDRDLVRRQLIHLLRGNPIDFSSRIVTRGGKTRWMRHRARPVQENGRVSYVYATGQEITERVRFEKALEAAYEHAEEARADAEKARADAESLMQRKSAFIANMSHEIRTPLTGIIGFADVLAEEVEAQHQEFSRLISASGRRLLETINSVLDLAQLEKGDMTLNPVEIDLAAEARETISVLRPLAQSRGLDLSYEGPASIQARLDRSCLARILTNLAGNALKFTDEGRVTVRASSTDGIVSIDVEDTGIGIEEPFLPHLFDEFRQADVVASSGRVGSGLGLSITRRLVELMGGTISVSSVVGVGTTFSIKLPEHGEALPATRQRSPDAPPSEPPPWRTGELELPTANGPETMFFRNSGPGKQPDAPDDSPSWDAPQADDEHPSNIPDLSALFGLDDRREVKSAQDLAGDSATYTVRSVFADVAPNTESASEGRSDDDQEWSNLGWNGHSAFTGEDQSAAPGDGVAQPAALHSPPPLPQNPEVEEDGRLKVLVVEDNPEARQLICRVLRPHYSIEEAQDARSALDLMSKHSFDVLVMDIHLGGKQTGADVLRIARTLPGYENVTAVAVTAYALPGDRERFLEAGFDGYVSKPFTVKVLLETLVEAGAPAGVRR